MSLNAVARGANIYRYFESREDLFLQLTLASLEARSDTILRTLPMGSESCPAPPWRNPLKVTKENRHPQRAVAPFNR